MLSRADLKQQAKEQLKGNLGMLFLCTLIVTAISFVLALIPVVGTVATYIIAPPLSLGLIMVYLSVTYGEKVEIGTLFNGFQSFGKSILLYLLIMIFTLLWSLLLIIPGIIKAYSYSMAFYILAENPDMTAREALNESKLIMDGHKMELFVLQLSFILWILLTGITLGIAGIYVYPYMQLTLTNFYHNIKRKSEEPVYEAAAEVVE